MNIDITKTFNNSYKLYLNGIPSMIFMNNFLEKCTKLLGFNAGFIASTYVYEETRFMTFEAIYNSREFLRDDVAFPENTKYNITDDISMCAYCLAKGKPVILFNNEKNEKNEKNAQTKNNSNRDEIDFFSFKRNNSGENLERESDFVFDIAKFKLIIYIPIVFNDEIIGILGMASKNPVSFVDINDQNIKIIGQSKQNDHVERFGIFTVIANYAGVLMSSYSTVKTSTVEIDRNFVTYQLTEQILNTIHDGLLVVDTCFDIVYINECAKSMIKTIYGEAFKSDFLDKNLLRIFPQLRILNPDSACTDIILKNRKVELSIKNKTDVYEIEFIFNTVVCNNVFYHVISMRNRESEQATSPKSDKINAINKNLIAYLSHELRNPLQTISLANCLVQSYIKSSDIPHKIKNSFDSINKACLDMKRIINDILDLSKLEANEFVINMDLIDIHELIEELVNDHIAKAISKGLALEYVISDDIPKTLYTDSTRITQILGNLISNAIKYSDKGTIVVSITYDEDKHGVLFSVTDDGIGIRDDEIGRLFKDYGQTSNSFKFNTDSNGLGLCISQKIANLLGGYIIVKSEYKKGSTFTMFHPIKLGTSGTLFEKKMMDLKLRGNILIVDDNESNLVLFKLLLENFNYEFDSSLAMESVTDGKDAIEVCKINNYDIIFMDINMPGIDGCTASKIIKRNGYSGVMIATTGNIMAKAENRSLIDRERYNCFDDIVIKPFDDTIILNILKKYLPVETTN